MHVTYRNQQWDLPGGMAARDLLIKLDIMPETVLVVRDGNLITEDTILKNEDNIKLVAVISGG